MFNIGLRARSPMITKSTILDHFWRTLYASEWLDGFTLIIMSCLQRSNDVMITWPHSWYRDTQGCQWWLGTLRVANDDVKLDYFILMLTFVSSVKCSQKLKLNDRWFCSVFFSSQIIPVKVAMRYVEIMPFVWVIDPVAIPAYVTMDMNMT